MHKYDHHVGDYVRDTVGLSMQEDGAYRRLLDQYYATELPLPPDKREVYRMARATSPAERKAVDYVLSKYFQSGPDGFHNGRADREIGSYQTKSDGATHAAAVRWENHRKRIEAAKDHANAHANAYAVASEAHMRDACTDDAIGMPTSARVPLTVLHPPPSGGKPTREPPSAFAPPDWVPRQEWDDFDDMRRRKSGKGWTLRARELAVGELAKLVEQGEDAAAVLRQSVVRTWTGLFPARDQQPKRGRGGTLAESRAATIADLTGRRPDARTIDSTAGRVDSPPVPALPGGVRESGGDHVG